MRRALSAAGAGALTALWIGCTPSPRVALPPSVAATDLLVLGALEDGHVVRGAMLAFGDELPAAFADEPGVALAVLAVGTGPDSLIGPDARALAHEWVRKVELRRSSDPVEGSCGRCTAGGDREPAVILPGDRCPVPSTARAYVDGTSVPIDDPRIEVIRAEHLLQWPGACGCGDMPQRRAIEPTALLPVVDPLEPEAVVLGAGGAVGIFSERSAGIVDAASGARAQAGPTMVPFVGPVLVALPVTLPAPGAEFLVVSAIDPISVQRSSRARLDLVAGGGGAGPLSFTPLSIDEPIVRLRAAIETAPGRLLIGSETEQEAAILACTLDGARASLDCDMLTHGELAADDRGTGQITALTQIDEQTIVAIDEARIVIGRIGGSRPSWVWTVDPWRERTLREAPSLPRQPAPIEQFAFQSIASIGRRIFVCAHGRHQGGGQLAFVATADVPAAGPVDLEVVQVGPVAQCSRDVPGFWRRDARELQLTLASDVSAPSEVTLVLTATGGVRVSTPPLREQIDLSRPIEGVLADREWIVALDHGGAVHASRAGMGSSRRLFGPESYDDRHTQAITSRGHQLWSFSRGATARVVEVRGGEPALVERTLLGVAASDRVSTALHQRATDRVWIAGVGESGEGWVRSFEPDESAAPIPVEELELAQRVRVFDWVDAGDGTILALNRSPRILRIGGGGAGDVRDVEIDWRPETPAIDGEPPAIDGCRFRAAGPEAFVWQGVTPFRAIDVAQGIVWVSGCSGTLLRIPPPWTRAERVELSGFETSQVGVEKLADLTAIRSVCPDRVLVAARGDGTLTDETGRLWWIEPSHASERSDRLSARPLSILDNPRPTNAIDVVAGDPIEIVGGGRGLVLVFSNDARPQGVLRGLGSPVTHRFSTVLGGAAENDAGWVAVGAGHGRLFLIEP